jgi:hypothetical protein
VGISVGVDEVTSSQGASIAFYVPEDFKSSQRFLFFTPSFPFELAEGGD